ncbi:MAG: DUF481 domain-containing protein [Alphaproteobacteria bacterium]|nr:MAG: DUF481 domain-containing protein [Alphaproteobacteria bacterium]
MRGLIGLVFLLAMPAPAARAQDPAPPALMAMIDKAVARADKPQLLIDVLLLALETAPDGAGALIDHAVAAAPAREVAILRAVNKSMPKVAGTAVLDDGATPAARLAALRARPRHGFFSAKGWDGEVALGGSYLTGNTEEQAVSLSIALDREGGAWEHHFGTTVDYSRNADTATKERLLTDYQIKWFFSERAYAFGQADFEYDRFSEFDWRIAEAGGLGYRVWEATGFSWDLEGGPGSRQTKLAADGTDIEFIGVLGSNVKWKINSLLRLTNTSSLFVGEDRTTLSNDAAVTASLGKTWSARLSFYVRHDTAVPVGQSKTDTASRLSVVYGF